MNCICYCIRNIKVILLLAIVFITHSYFIMKQTSVIESPNYISKNEELYQKSSKKIDEKYDQMIDLNIKFQKTSQNTCDECPNEFLLVILIHSNLSNVKLRSAIRKTWGKSTNCIKILYFVGSSLDYNMTRFIKAESDKHHDIIQGDFIDSYRNLTYKHVMLLKWAAQYCKQAKYIVKTDDDVMVNVKVLYEYLRKDYWGDKNLIACTVNYNTEVVRDDTKWSVADNEYPADVYPDYCLGPFIIYSADVVHRLLNESYKTPYFWIDDIYVTGMLANNIAINHTNIEDYSIGTADALLLRGPKGVKSLIYGPSNLKPDDMLKIWRAILILDRASFSMVELLKKFNTTSIVDF